MKHFSPANDVAISETLIEKNEQTCRVLVGDCIEAMRLMADQSVNCCVTSPPYYALRDYGVDGQIGLEETPEQFIAKLVEVFREVKRVLRDDGTLWINIGDSYASRPNGPAGTPKPDSIAPHVATRTAHARRSSHVPSGFKHKDLLGIPWMLAFALRADGWYLRQDIIWNKTNPMPESVRDRCTKAHEYVFLLSKSRQYYYDHEAIREPAVYTGKNNGVGFGHGTDKEKRDRQRVSMPTGWDTSTGEGAHGSYHKDGAARGSRRNSFARKTKYSTGTHGQKGQHRPDRPDVDYSQTRNKRSVWTLATNGFKGAHFATFPPALIEPCILAGCPDGGVVFDPFGGSGTTAGVAMKHGRNAVLCELNSEYAELIPARINSIIDVKPKKVRPKVEPDPARDENTLDMFDLFLKPQAKK